MLCKYLRILLRGSDSIFDDLLKVDKKKLETVFSSLRSLYLCKRCFILYLESSSRMLQNLLCFSGFGTHLQRNLIFKKLQMKQNNFWRENSNITDEMKIVSYLSKTVFSSQSFVLFGDETDPILVVMNRLALALLLCGVCQRTTGSISMSSFLTIT